MITSLTPGSEAELRTVQWRSADSWGVGTAPSPVTWTPLNPAGHWCHHLLPSSILRWSGVLFLWAFHPTVLLWSSGACPEGLSGSMGLKGSRAPAELSSLNSAALPCSTLITHKQGHPNMSPDKSGTSEQEIFVKLLNTVIIHEYRARLLKIFFFCDLAITFVVLLLLIEAEGNTHGWTVNHQHEKPLS